MKKSYLIAFIALVAAISIIVSASKDVSKYATFQSASMNQVRVKIAGTIDKSEDIIYDPVNTPNSFTFLMKDNDGQSNKVILKKAKPQDFERSETVVVTGRMDGNTFIADEVLMKCPSKYKDEELQLRAEADLPS